MDFLALFHMRTFYKLAFILVMTCFFCLSMTQPVKAHARYERSIPAANTSLESGKPPTQVQVWFTEKLVPQFSSLSIYDQGRKQIDAKNSHVDPTNSHSLVVPLPPGLPDGPYTVVYRVLSEEDGHAVTGSFSFVVGNAPLPDNTSLFTEEVVEETNFNTWSVALRWLNYLSMTGLIGSSAFFLWVWRSTVLKSTSTLGSSLVKANQRVSARIHLFQGWCLALLALGWGGFLVYQASIASRSLPWQVFTNNALSDLLLTSRFGSLWLVRLGLIILATLFWFIAGRLLRTQRHRFSDTSLEEEHDQKSQDKALQETPLKGTLLRHWLLLFLGVGITLTTSLNAHAAASSVAWLLVPTDLIHLISAGFWIGGLAAFLLTLPLAFRVLVAGSGNRTRFLALIIPRFSLIALISVSLLVLTGVIQTIFQLGSWEAFVNNSYGQALTLKLVFFVILIGLGAYNLLRVRPKMQLMAQSTDKEEGASSLIAGHFQRRFWHTLRLEVGLAILLLGIVGGLTSFGPPQKNASGTEQYRKQGGAGDLTYTVMIRPLHIGENIFEVELRTLDAKPLTKVDAVITRFDMLDMDMGVQNMELDPVSGKPGYYEARASVLSMAGQWRMTLLVRRTGFDDVKVSMPFTLKGEPFSPEKYTP